MPEPHVGICACRACHPDAPLLWAIDATLPLLALKADDPDPFRTDELALAAALSLAFGTASEDAYAMLQGAMQPPIDLRKLDEALDEASQRMRVLVTLAVAEHITSILEDAFRNGSIDATTGAPPDGRNGLRGQVTPANLLTTVPAARRVVDSTVDSVRHYVERYFDTVLRPGIVARVGKVLEETAATAVPSASALTEAVRKAFGAQGYFRLVANIAISRVYHYAMLKAAQLSGRRGYRWHSVVDSRTSEVCLTMNGLEFWVADAVNLMEGAAATDDPEAATKLMPWPDPVSIQGSTAAGLRAAGLLVPPAHPHCRSTLVVL